MDRKANVEVYRLRTLEKSENAPFIRLLSMNVSRNMYEYVANVDGNYGVFYGTPNEQHEQNIVNFYFNMPTDQKGSRYIWNYDLPVATDEYLLFLGENLDEAGLTARDYRNNKHVINLLKSHRQVIWKQGGNINKNNNIKSDIVSFELINTTANTIEKSKLEDLAIEAAYQLKKWREEDHQTYLNFCYLWGIKSIETFTHEALSSAITASVKANLTKYKEVLGWIGDEIRINVSKGVYTLAKNSTSEIIPKENNYYTFNGELAGATVEEVVNYFKTHPQAYTLLKNILGIKENVEVELPHAPKISLNPPTNQPSLLPQEQEKEKEKFLTQIEYRLGQVKNGKNILADKVKNAYPLIDGITTTTEDVLANLAKTEMVSKYGFQDVYWAKAYEFGLTKTLMA